MYKWYKWDKPTEWGLTITRLSFHWTEPWDDPPSTSCAESSAWRQKSWWPRPWGPEGLGRATTNHRGFRLVFGWAKVTTVISHLSTVLLFLFCLWLFCSASGGRIRLHPFFTALLRCSPRSSDSRYERSPSRAERHLDPVGLLWRFEVKHQIFVYPGHLEWWLNAMRRPNH